MTAVFTAKYEGECENCDDPIRIGDSCRYDDDKVVHADCPDPLEPINLQDVCGSCHLVHNGECW